MTEINIINWTMALLNNLQLLTRKSEDDTAAV